MAGIVAFAILAAPAGAQTEGYYREMVVEGRIYVFSSENKYQSYQQSRDMGIAITRPGYGPNGETVIFEDARAVEIYNAKHGKTEVPPKEIKTSDGKLPFGVEYRAPGLRLTFPRAEIKLTIGLQVRYAHEQFDEIRTPPDPLPSSLEDKGSFRIRRLRPKFDGWVLSKDLTYELQWELADNSGNPLLDANLDYDFTGGKKLFRLKLGQFKAPFSYQQLVSTDALQLVDLSILDAFFVPGRQLGLQLWGQFGPKAVPDFVDWRAGVFNGNGRTASVNDNGEYEYVGRVMVSPWGSVGYTESNLEAYDLRLSFSGEYNSNDTIVQPATGAPTGTDVETFGAGVVLKAFKSLFLHGQYYSGKSDTPAGVRTDRDGWMIQGGWLLTPKWEIEGRWAKIDPNTNAANNDQKEWRAGVSWYLSKHNWKIQADYGVTENEAPAATTNRRLKEARVQAQLVF